jgi:SAM-dependent MidA family methyltransferase
LPELIGSEIDRQGPIPFRRFMELALYHPEHGYYVRDREPFGRSGDFYTAEQLQPVFGLLIAAKIRAFFEELGRPADFTVVELGAGRAEMAEALSEWRYVPVDIGRGSLPSRFTGVVFLNEFFDALPVEAAILRAGVWRELLVGRDGERFKWVEGGPAGAEVVTYIEKYLPDRSEGERAEVNLEALAWIESIARALERGFVLTIDYGYTSRESIRFPNGTLMSYQRHTAIEDVLAEPGERDITAHVCFTALERHGSEHGLKAEQFERLAQTLLAAGENEITRILTPADAAEERRRRLQFKTLLFGMGETFRTLIQRKR